MRSPEDWFEAFEPFHPHSLTAKTASKLIEGYSPEEYLFSHNTIIASVDVDPEQDHLILPESQPFINDNIDAWERGVISNDWRSFIGGYNYQEHVQIPDLSKGKIVDAALRDVGEALYVDILVATARKHERLIHRIQSGALNSMSMGCICDFTICGKCGNKAVDDTQVCACIRYSKGNNFIGPDGKQRRIAELCGHRNEPGSVRFIEASWVENPAFRGAVTRNLLSLPELRKKATSTRFFVPSALPVNPRGLLRAAHRSVEGQEDGYKGDDTLPPEAGPKGPERFTEDVFDFLYYDDNPSQNLTREYPEGDGQERPFDVQVEDSKDPPLEFLEENLIHSSKAGDLVEEFIQRYRTSGLSEIQLRKIREGVQLYRDGGFRRVAQAGWKGVELLSLHYFLGKYRPYRKASVETPLAHYALVRELQGISPFASEMSFLKVCTAKLGRKLASRGEAKSLLKLARLFDLGGAGA